MNRIERFTLFKLLSWAGMLIVVGALGCGTEPTSRVAVAGTTIMIPLPHPFGAYGRSINRQWDPEDPSNGIFDAQTSIADLLTYIASDPDTYGFDATNTAIEDPQRGELIFSLHDGLGFVTWMPLRYITRVHFDESASVAQEERDSQGDYIWRSEGQVVAFVDVPFGVPASDPGTVDYEIQVHRVRRSSTAPDQFVTYQPQVGSPAEDWTGWGIENSNHVAIPIYILASETFTDSTHSSPTAHHYALTIGYQNFCGSGSIVHGDFGALDDNSIEAANFGLLPDFVPNPQILLGTWDASWANPDPLDLPSAVDLQLEYPDDKIEILGIELGSNHRTNGIALWRREKVNNANDTLHISIVVPGVPEERVSGDQQWHYGYNPVYDRSAGIEITYRLVDFANEGRLEAGDVTITAISGYDRDGLLMSNYDEPADILGITGTYAHEF